jgi:hypothetical protein
MCSAGFTERCVGIARRDERYLQDVSTELDLVTVAEPSLAARAQRLPVQDDRILAAVIRDDEAASLERDAGMGA